MNPHRAQCILPPRPPTLRASSAGRSFLVYSIDDALRIWENAAARGTTRLGVVRIHKVDHGVDGGYIGYISEAGTWRSAQAERLA